MVLHSMAVGTSRAGAGVRSARGVPQLGAYYPFFRGHAHLETARREPWLFGEPTTTRIRRAIRGRYALLPYIYTLFRHAHLTGAPAHAPAAPASPANPPVPAHGSKHLVCSFLKHSRSNDALQLATWPYSVPLSKALHRCKCGSDRCHSTFADHHEFAIACAALAIAVPA